MERKPVSRWLVFLFSCWNASVSAVLSICKTKAPTLADCPSLTTRVGMYSLGPEPCWSHERHLRFCLYYASQECWVSRHRRAHMDSLLLLNSFHICFYIMWAQAVLGLSLPLSFFLSFFLHNRFVDHSKMHATQCWYHHSCASLVTTSLYLYFSVRFIWL